MIHLYGANYPKIHTVGKTSSGERSSGRRSQLLRQYVWEVLKVLIKIEILTTGQTHSAVPVATVFWPLFAHEWLAYIRETAEWPNTAKHWFVTIYFLQQ